RAAMAFSVFVVFGGLVLYAFGLAYVEQLGSRIYQALGLLTSLVGLMAIWATHDLGREIQTEGTTKPEKPSSSVLDWFPTHSRGQRSPDDSAEPLAAMGTHRLLGRLALLIRCPVDGGGFSS